MGSIALRLGSSDTSLVSAASLHTTNNVFYSLVKSSLVKLETSQMYSDPSPTVNILWFVDASGLVTSKYADTRGQERDLMSKSIRFEKEVSSFQSRRCYDRLRYRKCIWWQPGTNTAKPRPDPLTYFQHKIFIGLVPAVDVNKIKKSAVKLWWNNALWWSKRKHMIDFCPPFLVYWLKEVTQSEGHEFEPGAGYWIDIFSN